MNGDSPAPYAPNPLGNGLRLAQVQDPTSPDYHPNDNANMTSQVVTWLDTYDETMDGKSVGTLYVQDVGSQAPYAGVGIYEASLVPANLTVLPGDVLDLHGPYHESGNIGTATFPPGRSFPSSTSRWARSGTTSRRQSQGHHARRPGRERRQEDRRRLCQSRRWEGMLVTIQNVDMAAAVPGPRVTYPMGGRRHRRDQRAGHQQRELQPACQHRWGRQPGPVPGGTRFTSVTGIVTWFYTFHIAPRTAADLVVRSDRSASAALVLAVALAACGGGPGAVAPGGAGRGARARSTGEGRPPVSAVTRAGDAQGAIAVAVTTEGIAPERGAVPAVALAALVEARLASRAQVATVGGWGGWRLRALVPSAAGAAPLVDAIREAMLGPVATDDPAMAAVKRKVEALAQRPLADRAMVDVARCTGEPFGLGGDTSPTAQELEAWRVAAQGAGRVAFATAGDEPLAVAVTDALAAGPTWPTAAPVVPPAWPAADAPVIVYDASSEIAPGGASIVVLARTAVPERAVALAPALGDARGPRRRGSPRSTRQRGFAR